YRHPVILIADDTRLSSLIALVRTLTQFAARIASPTPQAAVHPNGASMTLASGYRRPSHRRRHRHRDPRVDAGAGPRIRLRQLTLSVLAPTIKATIVQDDAGMSKTHAHLFSRAW